MASKVVIVTGGTTGIGLATARKPARAGAQLVIFGRHHPEPNEALAEIQRLGEVRWPRSSPWSSLWTPPNRFISA